MSDQAPFAVQAALRRHYEREVHSQLGVTLRALLRSDGGRLAYFDATQVVNDYIVQRRYVAGEVERVAIEAAQNDPNLSAAVGYEIGDLQSRPLESAWLVDGDGQVIDPAKSRRPVLGFLGVVLRSGELANWTPEQPGAVAERVTERMRVSAS